MNRRLFRSPDDRVLAGVAGGMAETYDFDPALVRVMWALLILVTGGVFLILYIVMALVVPLRPAGMPAWTPMTPDGSTPPAGPAGPGDPANPTGPTAAQTPPGYYRNYRRHDGSGALVFGMILILAGAYFFARQFIPALNAALVWPVVIIGVGLLFIVFAFGRGRSAQ
jgi:phage shock protein C